MKAVTPTKHLILADTDQDDLDEPTALAGNEPPVVLALSPGDCGERLDKVLARRLPQYSRSRLQQWIEAGLVTVNGKPAHSKSAIWGDETIVVQPKTAPEEMAFLPEAIDFPIIFEDASLIVLDKPAGLVVHPAAGNWSGTLLNGLLHHHPPLAGLPRAGIVHRLDKDTSGLMVVAKTLEAQTELVRQLQERTIRREYLALVWGVPHVRGKVDAAIGRHPRDRLKMAVRENVTAKPAVTHFEKLATGAIDRHQVSLVRCRLETGRTHQIRVHMQSIGHPLVGDATYGKQHLAQHFHRQALHASILGLTHPKTGQACEWQASLPDDFAALLDRCGLTEWKKP